MNVLKDLVQQLKRHGIESVTEIGQTGPTAITERFAKQINGGATGANTTLLDLHYNFSLTIPSDGSTFCQSI